MHPRMNGLAISALWVLFGSAKSQPAASLPFGALYPSMGGDNERAARIALDMVRTEAGLASVAGLTPIANYTGLFRDMEGLTLACDLLEQGVVAIVGPLSSGPTKSANTYLAAFNVPQLAPAATDPSLEDNERYPFLLRMLPSDRLQSSALVEFLDSFNFNSLALLTDTSDYGMNGLVELQIQATLKKWRIVTTQHFQAKSNLDAIDARPQLRAIRNSGAKLVVVNCHVLSAGKVLGQAAEMGMLDAGWMWLGTDGITGTNELEEAVKTLPALAGLMGSRPVTASGALYADFAQRWAGETGGGKPPTFAQAYADAVLTLATGLRDYLASSAGPLTPQRFDCASDAAPWAEGRRLFEALTRVKRTGVMHPLAFTDTGAPAIPTYEYVRLSATNGWERKGTWSPNDGINVPDIEKLTTLKEEKVSGIRDFVGDLINKTLRVVTMIEPPFVQYMEKTDDCPKENPLCLEGYCIDLLMELQKTLQFNVEWELATDGVYGVQDPKTKAWNGLVAWLIPDSAGETRADLILAPLTISSERERVISFSKPFRDLRMTLLVGYKEEATYDPFSFLVPFETQLWIYIILTTFAVGIYLAIVDKLSPYGHHGKKVQNESEDEFEEMDINEDGTIDEWERRNWVKEKEAMSFHNAIFWSFASFFEQGGEQHPRAWSGRVAAGAWWFGIVIIISTYTANLAAFLTIRTPVDQINSLEQLANQEKVKFSFVRGTEVENFFREHPQSIYKRLLAKMDGWNEDTDTEWYWDATVAAVGDVGNKTPTMALITDSPIAEYYRGLDCANRRLIGNGFGYVGYGLGLPLESPYREELSIAILGMREGGKVDGLDYKWITKASTCSSGASTAAATDGGGQQIELDSMLGVFYVIYAGFGVAFLILVFEWIVSAVASVDAEHPRCGQEPSLGGFG